MEQTNEAAKGERFPLKLPPPFVPMAAKQPPPLLNFNNCLTKTIASFIGGGLMGMVFGPISSAMSAGPMDHDPNANWKQKVVSVRIFNKFTI